MRHALKGFALAACILAHLTLSTYCAVHSGPQSMNWDAYPRATGNP